MLVIFKQGAGVYFCTVIERIHNMKIKLINLKSFKMTTLRRISDFTGFLALMLTSMSFSLDGNLDKTDFRLQNMSLQVTGTSTLHDWQIKSTKGQAEAAFVLAADK